MGINHTVSGDPGLSKPGVDEKTEQQKKSDDPRTQEVTEIIGKKSDRLNDVRFILALVLAWALSMAMALAWLLKLWGVV